MKGRFQAAPFAVAIDSRSANVDLRPAAPTDRTFCYQLYLACMKPWLTALGTWNANRIEALFDEYFVVDEISVTRLDQKDIGYLQVTTSNGAMNLDQFHLLADFQRRGIGTQLLRKVIAEARAYALPLRLDLIRGNPAQSLYAREGFEITHSDDTKHYMALNATGAGKVIKRDL